MTRGGPLSLKSLHTPKDFMNSTLGRPHCLGLTYDHLVTRLRHCDCSLATCAYSTFIASQIDLIKRRPFQLVLNAEQHEKAESILTQRKYFAGKLIRISSITLGRNRANSTPLRSKPEYHNMWPPSKKESSECNDDTQTNLNKTMKSSPSLQVASKSSVFEKELAELRLAFQVIKKEQASLPHVMSASHGAELKCIHHRVHSQS